MTMDGLRKLLRNHDKTKPISIIDLGCGSGDTLRQIADFGLRHGYSFKLTGIDANEHVIDYARTQSGKHEDIKFLTCNIFSEEFKTLEYDIVICSLFLHHFDENQLTRFLPMVLDKASIGILANDLHRHPIAYLSFQALSIFISNEMVIKDGLTSIKRGFKRNELKQLSEKIDSKYNISWKWAFRYQWLIQQK